MRIRFTPPLRLRPPLAVAALFACFTLALAAHAADQAADDACLRRMNTGAAQLENGDFAAAILSYQEVLALRPADMAARRNLARAQLFSGNVAGALATLETTRADPAHLAATEYLTGLAHLRRDHPAEALPFLEHAVRLEPNLAALRFQLAKTFERLDRGDDAVTQFRETVRLDPQHASARFELAMYARSRRDLPTYREELRAYKHLRDLYGDPEVSPLLLEACALTRAESPLLPAGEKVPADPPLPVRFTVQSDPAAGVSALAPLELDATGNYTLVVLTRDGQLRLATLAPDGTLRLAEAAVACPSPGDRPLLRVAHYHDVIASEDRLKPDIARFADVLVVGASGLRLFERTDATTLTDVTERAELLGATGGRDALWLDYEHDGDVDFVIVSDTGLALWVNRGDGRFEPAAPGTGVNGSGRSLGAADLDGNGAVDLIVAHGEFTQVHENQRAGVFRDMPTPPGPWAPADRVLVNDLDNDGRPDAALIAADRTQFQLGGFGLGGEILHPGFAVTAATFTDYDNDGWLDLVLAGSVTAETARAQVRVWRNEAGPGYRRSWRDVSSELGIADAVIASPREALSIDCDNDGDSDLLFLSADGRFTLLRNDSGHANRQLKVRLSNLALANHGGIGATVAVRAGRTVIHRIVSAELPLEIGVGRLGAIDSVQVVWPDGTVDNLIDPPAGAGLATVQRASMIITGSCPYLFAWDGERFRFVTDFLGSGALGLALTRDVTWPPDPVELVRIGDATEFRPRDGRYLINLTSELREVDYFDALELVAVDHPAGTEVHPTDSFMPPPVTPSELWTVSEPIPLRAARDTRGHDVTAPLGEIDGIYALPGDVLPPPLHGVCRPHRCTLDFGELPAGAPLTIAVTGLLEFGTANTNIALSQTDTASLVWPTLEVETADGTWQTVAVNLGIPDGRTKTIVADLTGKLSAGSRRLRLTTSFEIYWDRVALFRRRELPGPHRHTRPFSFAELRWRGFSRQSRAVDGHTRVAHYDDVQPQPPWHTTLEGWCTRYGDALELVTAVDGKLAILNGGDELQLACPADAFPPVPAGCTRTFFLSAVGWDKEENNNTVHGATIEPLPGQPAAAASTDDLAQTDEWMRRYNTRWVPRHRFAPDASASLH